MQETVEAVQRMQDYIEANLGGNITLAALSKVSLYSPWYSYRLFTQWTGLTPADYIRRLRRMGTFDQHEEPGRRAGMPVAAEGVYQAGDIGVCAGGRTASGL